MYTYKVKADQELFDAWRCLGERVKLVSSIVQNTIELTGDDRAEWGRGIERLKADLDRLALRTAQHIVSG